ncbi:MAG: D-glutamate cyclase family protein [Planctomycetota bacterium]
MKSPKKQISETQPHGQWDFWIDRGGTFTDVVARDVYGKVRIAKLLSKNPEQYEDAAVQGIRDFLGLDNPCQPLPAEKIRSIRMGTTVATNALLERQGSDVCLVVTQGFGDLLEIGYQDRPDIFALEILKPESLIACVVEAHERILVDGTVRQALDEDLLKGQLQEVYDQGIRSLAVVLLHSYAYPEHEKRIGELARDIGFSFISLSHNTAGEIKVVSRGYTTAVDAYLTPVLWAYVSQVRSQVGHGVDLKFMQSHGGLTDAETFMGKDAIFSGPAGGVVACAYVASQAKLKKVIGFDMGGTSTDVSRFDGQFERIYETVIAGARIQAPMLNIVTVAAGGGSILKFQDGRFCVGPDSAGADPGPVCYRRNGPLAVTDANVVVGRIQSKFFPKCFGPNADQSLDINGSRQAFSALSERIRSVTGKEMSIEEIAAGFLRIANENMVRAIREVSVMRGYDVREYALVCFGGAGAQHACAIAGALGVRTILLHPLGGVLSAYGMGLADVIFTQVEAVLEPYQESLLERLESRFLALESNAKDHVSAQGIGTNRIQHIRTLDLRYKGVETSLNVILSEQSDPREMFETLHQRLFGYIKTGHSIEVVNLRVETCGQTPKPDQQIKDNEVCCVKDPQIIDSVTVFFDQINKGGLSVLEPQKTPVYRRSDLEKVAQIDGPALIIEDVSTVVVDLGWSARVNEHNCLLLEAVEVDRQHGTIDTDCDPVLLEVFNNLFMSIAEQMGITLRKVSHSTNIKERLDFSCAIFDGHGQLVANAPHIPVHLGAMGESVAALIDECKTTMRPGDVYVTNDPYHGGSHLPDVTVVTPVFMTSDMPVFFVASRGHHADIGGITPGSMPPFATSIEQEGILIHNFCLVREGAFREKEIIKLLEKEPYPARNVPECLSDLRAAIAANNAGVRLLDELNERVGLSAIRAYMEHVRNNAEYSMREVLKELPDGKYRFTDCLDDGSRICVTISIESDHAEVDFFGTDPQVSGSLNAPRAVVTAAVLYVFRTLIPRPIPLNAGCLKPVRIKIPKGCLLNPKPPAAVAGGNVETSMRITDVLYGALGKMAAGQGTMNNLTFGTDRYAYYETICGGAGAGLGFDGAHAVHTHMTNTRITDPEVLERRYPVVLRRFSVRKDSGGRGVWNGGNGVQREIEFLEPMTASILSERRDMSPFGLNGAENGKPGQNQLIHQQEVHNLPGKTTITVNSGDVLCIQTPGGGAYNPTLEQWADMSPETAREIFCHNRYIGPTAGFCAGHVQANLVILPESIAGDFEWYCQKNPKPCPLLERLPVGDPLTYFLAKGSDIRFDLPLYRIYQIDGSYEDVTDLSQYWREYHVAFLLGCSFSFEDALTRAGLVPRHIEQGVNIPMYKTNRSTIQVGSFKGPLVVTMRPIPKDRIEEAYKITEKYKRVHGAPVCNGDAKELGIPDLAKPDWGDPVTIRANEIPVYWASGVTSQVAIMNALKSGALVKAISHTPGYMFIGDLWNQDLEGN